MKSSYLQANLPCPVGAPPSMKMDYTAKGTESAHTGRKHFSAPSLKAKLTGDTWSHHQVSRSPEQHADTVLVVKGGNSLGGNQSRREKLCFRIKLQRKDPGCLTTPTSLQASSTGDAALDRGG